MLEASSSKSAAPLVLPSPGVLQLRLGPTQTVLLVALYLALSQNHAFLASVLRSLPSPFTTQEMRVAGSAALAMYGLLVLFLLPFSAPRVFRPAASLLLIVAAVCSYFMDSFGTVIDRSMIINVLRTDAHEAGDLLRPAFFLHVFIQGVLPAVLLWRCKIRYGGFLRELRNRGLVLLAVLVGVFGLMATQYSELAFWGRENREVRLYLNPITPFFAALRVARESMPSGPAVPPALIATDAVRVVDPEARPLLVVLVVGETARAANFALNGYSRPTNPKLAQTPGLINFSDVRSCGTATAESVPCMFSLLQRSGFSRAKAKQQENLLDVLKRVGVDVVWRDNDSGCQGVCQRTGSLSVEQEKDPVLCNDDGCYDGILLRAVEQDFPTTGQARLLVLHQKGSHGPAYFKRYPESSRRFQPDCRDENVQRCSQEETINAYDNTIVYTDEVLSSIIDVLKDNQNRMDSVLIYVSDHGESLGENGIYLHGLPYAMAPEEQTHVPMLAWFSSQAPASLGMDLSCVKKTHDRAFSHDNLFSSLLGIMNVRTSAYIAQKDMFSDCRRR